jgi:hypothetical protein
VLVVLKLIKIFDKSVKNPIPVNKLNPSIRSMIQEKYSSLENVSVWAMRESPKNKKL